MFTFPQNLYTDVRIEDVFESNIIFSLGNLDEQKQRKYKAAFIRVFDGTRWYYSSTSNIEAIQREIDNLARIATANSAIGDHPIVQKLEANQGEHTKFRLNSVAEIGIDQKLDLLQDYFPIISENSLIKMWKGQYVDQYVVKKFYSSKGANLHFDAQKAGISLQFEMAANERKFSERFQKASHYFSDLQGRHEELKAYISKCEDFLHNYQALKPGKYTTILSPVVAGVFAHESFGHKSESDFMVGDETMKKEWAIGKKVGADILSIIDDGSKPGSGFVPFDDEGTRSRETHLIKNGILAGRLHSAATAGALDEDVTGNARAINFEFEPIVRMTTTYIASGDKTKDELFSEVKEGIYIETLKHGSGMSTFTIAPSISYYIKDGKIAYPVNIAVITGNVFETLGEIDGLSNQVELESFVIGGCGKMEQYPLSVGFGGPYVRVKNINAQ
ncbi:MAG: TldD/PmbA family protein [Firmicutes bacterium]|nr:TldD/PmbA family protein [Bacillota bacterium]